MKYVMLLNYATDEQDNFCKNSEIFSFDDFTITYYSRHEEENDITFVDLFRNGKPMFGCKFKGNWLYIAEMLYCKNSVLINIKDTFNPFRQPLYAISTAKGLSL